MIKKILPGSTIGIIGGGQLGMMTVQAANKLGYKTVIWDPEKNAPAFKFADKIICKSFSDLSAAVEIAELSDVVTYEFEHIDYENIKVIEKTKSVFPPSELLYISQHREREKESLRKNGFPIVPFKSINNVNEIKNTILEIGLPVVVKTTTHGYDGKGQWIISNENEIENLIHNFRNSEIEAVIEKFIELEKEFSVIVASNGNGIFENFPVIENEHRLNILHKSIVPSNLKNEIIETAITISKNIAKSYNLIGILCVEMFLDKSGKIFVNELAPRPHNSGHFSIDACNISQFEMLVRTICGLEIMEPKIVSQVAMVNLLGKHLNKIDFTKLNEIEGTFLHLYGKSENRELRKMGHINILAKSENELLNKILTVEKLIGEN